jgi:hypothetical protein
VRPALLTSSLLIAGLAGALGPAAPASADRVFHTTRYPLTAVGGSGVTGTVIDIHTEGPRISAQERYQLRGAVPGESYEVQLLVSFTGCGTLAEFPGGPSTTANAAGNAVAKRRFPVIELGVPELYLRWVLVVAGDPTDTPVAQTDCVTVAVD